MKTLVKIKVLRELRNHTQATIAQHLCMSLSAYKKLELGINKEVNLRTLRNISQILDTKVSILADNSNDILEPSEEERNFEKEIRKMQIKIGDCKLMMTAQELTIERLKNPEPTQASPDVLHETKKAQHTLRIQQQKANFEEMKVFFARKWKENVIDFEEYKKSLPLYLR